MRLILLEEELAVARLEATEAAPAWAREGSFSSVTRTGEELSVVCASSDVPEGVRAERGFRCLRVAGRIDFSEIGVLASLAGPLAARGVSLLALSTYDTDYVLVRKASLVPAIECLRAAGHEVTAP